LDVGGGVGYRMVAVTFMSMWNRILIDSAAEDQEYKCGECAYAVRSLKQRKVAELVKGEEPGAVIEREQRTA